VHIVDRCHGELDPTAHAVGRNLAVDALQLDPPGPPGDVGIATRLDLDLARRRANPAHTGHLADLVRIPYDVSSPHRVVNDILVSRLLRVRQTPGDVLITLAYPAHFIHHPHKIIWMGGLEDKILRAGGDDGIQKGPDQGWHAVRDAERQSLEEAYKVFSVSQTAADQVFEIHGLRPTILRPPSAPDLDWPQTIAELLG